MRALQARGDAVTVLSRDPDRARAAARRRRGARLAAAAGARAGRGAERARRGRAPGRRERGPALDRRGAARDPRVARDRHAQPRRRASAPPTRARASLVSASAVGYYGPARRRAGRRGRRRPATTSSPGCASAWEREAARAAEHGLRVAMLRTGVVLDREGGALAKMLPFFRLGIGGPVAGGRQYLPWIHADDIVGLYLAALDDAAWEGADQRQRARARHQPRLLARPRAARCTGPPSRPSRASRVRLLYGDMAEIVTTGQRAVPDARARARLRLPPHRSRRGPARRARADVGSRP